MNEIKEAIILAAGKSRRMGRICEEKPKCLLKYKNQTILKRILNQLKETSVKKAILVVGFAKEKVIEEIKDFKDLEIEIIENPLYETDTNIYSMKLALEVLKGPTIILESDLLAETSLIKYIAGSDFEGKSVWFTKGNFNDTQIGGILDSNPFGNISDIKIVPSFSPEFKNYRKLTGLMRIGPNEISRFKDLVNIYNSITHAQYYLIPWIENLNILPCIEGNTDPFEFATFNTEEDFINASRLNFDEPSIDVQEIEFVEVKDLKHIENFDTNRVEQLAEKIKKEGFWTQPIFIEKNHNLILDGQHRTQAARRLGIKKIPVQKFNYEDIKVWSLRKEEKVDISTVIKRANAKNIYPYKTVKHKFPKIKNSCNINLNDLIQNNLVKKQKKLIILAAGQGFKLDGINKLLIKDPFTKETLIEKYQKYFKDYQIEIVVGYKAIEVISNFPQFKYIYNNRWKLTGNSYSLALALENSPSLIISSDLFFDEKLVELIENSPEDSIFIKNSENKELNTVRCKIDSSNNVKKIFFDNNFIHPDLIGIFKISSPEIIQEWKRRCMNNKNTFCGINLPVENQKIKAIDIKNLFFQEINTHKDYINLIKKLK